MSEAHASHLSNTVFRPETSATSELPHATPLPETHVERLASLNDRYYGMDGAPPPPPNLKEQRSASDFRPDSQAGRTMHHHFPHDRYMSDPGFAIVFNLLCLGQLVAQNRPCFM
eukprot:CAMPEP_0185748394 /NCGR_PEP_ID=MMETSP1174-20130828/7080_1 /TAXON_ID=35687 /ORGANISM="Dictyocha speculum, Strain CCMP1381" /LENGTH=113 /DNA_ID=CAMNT_0028424045 /DNA_START=36 /DNA_END=377 /DNA_ORIENTATION=+